MKAEDIKEKEPKDLDIPVIDLEKEAAEEPDPEEEDPDVILETHAAALHVDRQTVPLPFSTCHLKTPTEMIPWML